MNLISRTVRSRRAAAAVAITVILIIGASIALFSKVGGKSAASDSHPTLLDCEGCNLVIIAIDTLRADHLPFYGYRLNTAPFLSRLAEKSSVFERAFSPSSWTAPAAASYFTSVFPSRHGVITGFSATAKFKKKDPTIELNRIPADLETLGEFASSLGFTTVGVADNLNIGKEIGFDRGFAHFKKYRYKGAKRMNAQAREFLSQIKKDKPYFLYLHYMDPHEPFHRRQPFFKECLKESREVYRAETICAYDSEISYVDRYIKALFDEYDWFNNSVVILLSDHGEEFWDHGKQGHGTSLYTELIHVPFLIYHPKWPAQRIKRNVNTVDLLPTVAGLAGHPESSVWQGRNLVPVLGENAPEADSRIILSERFRHPSSRRSWTKRSVVVDDNHYIETTGSPEDEDRELFDLANDFVEKVNLADSLPGKVDEMAGLLALSSHSSPTESSEKTEIEVKPELLKELRSLGYID